MNTLLALLLIYRAANRLPPVRTDTLACRVAVERILEVKTDWSHKGFFANHIVAKSGYAWQENLAKNFVNPVDVMNAWKKSPTHNKNLLSNMKRVCFMHFGNYWVMEGY